MSIAIATHKELKKQLLSPKIGKKEFLINCEDTFKNVRESLENLLTPHGDIFEFLIDTLKFYLFFNSGHPDINCFNI